MDKKYKVLGLALFALVFIAGIAYLLRDYNFEVLNPKGTIAQQQYDLIIFAALLSLIVVVPVFSLTAIIAWKYRATNTKAKYTPEVSGNHKLEVVWWGIPIALITILSVVTWQSSHALDPFRPLASEKEPLNVQVVALQWKWLFIYPEHDIATVNFVEFPADRPVDFVITADAPMNSFWIPQLGGQIYAMSGMSTKLHLMATEEGAYRGSSANISGAGFARMTFTANATSDAEFEKWVEGVKQSSNVLTKDVYAELAKPNEGDPYVYPPTFYSSKATGLYDTILAKYMMHGETKMGGHE